METKIVQKFKGEINGVEFSNEYIYRIVEYVGNAIEEKFGLLPQNFIKDLRDTIETVSLKYEAFDFSILENSILESLENAKFSKELFINYDGLQWKMEEINKNLREGKYQFKKVLEMEKEKGGINMEDSMLKSLEQASEAERDNETFVLKYLKEKREKNEFIVFSEETDFRFASPRLQNDKNFCLKVLEILPNSLKHMSEELRNDQEIIFSYFKGEEGILYPVNEQLTYMGKKLKEDREFVKEICRDDGSRLCFANKKFLNDREMIEFAIQTKPWVIMQTTSEFREKNKDLVKKSLEKDGGILSDLPLKGFRDNPEFILPAVKNTGDALKFAFLDSEDPEVYSEIFKEAIENPSNKLNPALSFLPEDYQTYELVEKAIEINSFSIAFAREDLANHPILANRVIEKNIENFSRCGIKFQEEKIQENPEKYLYHAKIPVQVDFLEKEGNLKYKSFAVKDAQLIVERNLQIKERMEEKRKIPKKSKGKNDKQRE